MRRRKGAPEPETAEVLEDGDLIVEAVNVTAEIQRLAREVAREEIASLCGLVLRRLGDPQFTMRWDKHGVETVEDDANAKLKAIFGEALRDFGASPDEPGRGAA